VGKAGGKGLKKMFKNLALLGIIFLFSTTELLFLTTFKEVMLN
jgi:hypothetical protein